MPQNRSSQVKGLSVVMTLLEIPPNKTLKIKNNLLY